jgi:imidazolonepropionase-like amidohydrolase
MSGRDGKAGREERPAIAALAAILTITAGLALAGQPAARAETIAIVGAKVHTVGPQGTIDGATVLIDGGRIRAVGRDVAVPAGARRIDAAGKVVTPGLFDSFSGLGLVEVSAVEGSQDSSVEDDRITAAFDVVDALNPDSSLLPVNRVEGLTRAVVAPGPGESLIAGRGAVIHLGQGPELVVRAPVAMFAVLGERGAGLAGGSRGGAMLRLKEALQDAKDYAAHRAAFEGGNRREYALSRLDLEALVPVVEGKLPLVVSVDRASDIRAALRLAEEYDLKLILARAAEGWRVAEEIAAAKVPVVVDPMENLPGSFEALGATLENAARLRKAGVTIALMSGESHNARNVRQSAGNAVANGLPWEEGLRALTAAPAAIWGIADRYGTLEPGKDADVVIWDGDPLELTSFPERVFIRGAEMPRDSRQLQLRDRYLELGGEMPPAYRNP